MGETEKKILLNMPKVSYISKQIINPEEELFKFSKGFNEMLTLTLT